MTARTWLKAAIVIGWVALQLALIVTAGRRPEHAFGFRMFPEASTISYSLARVVRTSAGPREIVVKDGHYFVRHDDGSVRHYEWRDWIPQRALGAFDREIFASYGAAAQLSRMSLALEAFARYVGDDGETERFVLHGYVKRNGGAPEPFRFESAPR